MSEFKPNIVFRKLSNTPAYIEVESEQSTIAGDEYNRIITTKDYGNIIVGNTTFTAHPENIKINGVFAINGLNTSTMASTIVTPIPLLTYSFPLQNSIKHILKLSEELLNL